MRITWYLAGLLLVFCTLPLCSLAGHTHTLSKAPAVHGQLPNQQVTLRPQLPAQPATPSAPGGLATPASGAPHQAASARSNDALNSSGYAQPERRFQPRKAHQPWYLRWYMLLTYTVVLLSVLAIASPLVLGVSLSASVFVAYFFAWSLVALIGWFIWLLVRRLFKR